MPTVNRDFGQIGGHPIRVLDTPEYLTTRYLAWQEDGPGSAFGPTREIAIQRLKDRAERGWTTGDPVRRALLRTGGEALSTRSAQAG